MATVRPERERAPVQRRAAALGALLALCGAAAAADLGTLFHSPEERERLDRLRRGDSIASETVVAVPGGKREVTGFVRRSDGRGTVFINGVPVVVKGPDGAELFDREHVRAPGESEVRIERAPGARVKR